jgi:maleate isomerase
MTDVLGWRTRIGVLVPSTNTILEPELYAMAPRGVTCHVSRMYVPQAAIGSAAEADVFIQNVRAATELAIRDILTIQPDCLVHGFTGLSFMGGMAGHKRLKEQLEARAGLRVTTGAEAVVAALRACGARNVAIVTPQPEMMDEHYRQFFAASDLPVARVHHIRCATALDIARVDEVALRRAMVDVNGDDSDAIVCVGADLASARFADEAERWLGKPVIAMSTALLWYTLRAMHITDQVWGFGFLLRDH